MTHIKFNERVHTFEVSYRNVTSKTVNISFGCQDNKWQRQFASQYIGRYTTKKQLTCVGCIWMSRRNYQNTDS